MIRSRSSEIPPAPAAADRDSEDEREQLAAALAEHGSLRAAARALGIGESTLRGPAEKARHRGADEQPGPEGTGGRCPLDVRGQVRPRLG